MKMLRTIFLTVGFTVMILGCKALQKPIETNADLNQMMAQKAFKIDIRTIEPQVTQAMRQIANSGILPPGNTISRINVVGSGYYVKVKGDSVSANLPYYGERQMGGGFNSDAGIKFNEKAKDLVITKDESNQSYILNFDIDSGAENYFVTLTLNNNLTSWTAIRSSQRNTIRYTGDVKEFDLE